MKFPAPPFQIAYIPPLDIPTKRKAAIIIPIIAPAPRTVPRTTAAVLISASPEQTS
jgi:hypothetical protein